MTGLAGRAWDSWNRIFDEPGSLRAAAILRMLLGPVVLIHLMPFFNEMAAGHYYGDTFHLPWFHWLPPPTRELYYLLLCTCGVSAVSLCVGFQTRASAIYTWAFVTYNFFLSQTHFKHNRAFLVINLTCLMLVPCGHLLSLDARAARRRGRPLPDQAVLWPLYLLRFEAVSTYAASGTSKLLNPDWWDGLVMFDRVRRFRHALDASVAPQWFIDLITTREFYFVFAKVAVLTELFIAVGLVLRPTRYAAVWVAFMFHFSIGVGLHVQVFSYLAISALLIWAVPRTRDRKLLVNTSGVGGRFLLWCGSRLDWLGRFECSVAGPGQGTSLVDRDGRRLTGASAARVALSRCPLLFVPVAPFQLPGLRLLWDRVLRRAFP